MTAERIISRRRAMGIPLVLLLGALLIALSWGAVDYLFIRVSNLPPNSVAQIRILMIMLTGMAYLFGIAVMSIFRMNIDVYLAEAGPIEKQVLVASITQQLSESEQKNVIEFAQRLESSVKRPTSPLHK